MFFVLVAPFSKTNGRSPVQLELCIFSKLVTSNLSKVLSNSFVMNYFYSKVIVGLLTGSS